LATPGANWKATVSALMAAAAGIPGGLVGQIQYNNGGVFGGMTADQVSAASNGAAVYNAQIGTTYTLVAADNGKVITLNNASAITLTCPAALGAGFSCRIIQLGAGQVGVVAGAGATLNARSALTHLSGQYAMGIIVAPTADNFILGGGQTA
jgi:hypothetical protein